MRLIVLREDTLQAEVRWILDMSQVETEHFSISASHFSAAEKQSAVMKNGSGVHLEQIQPTIVFKK